MWIPRIHNGGEGNLCKEHHACKRPRTPRQQRSFGLHSESASSSSSSSSSSSVKVLHWAKQETLGTLLPREDALLIIDELLHNTSLLDSSEHMWRTNWNALQGRLRNETRTVRQLLGDGTTQQLLQSLQQQSVGYDADAVRTFLGSDAVNALFAVILYDAISEFLTRMDVFGNIVNQLPIIGPIRKQITQQVQASLNQSLGPIIQTFLQAYTKVAIQEAVAYVLNEQNQQAFAKANVKLVSSLLDRPVKNYFDITNKGVMDKLLDDGIDYIRNQVDMEDVERYVDMAYNVVEDKTLQDFVSVDEVLEASPTLQRTLDRIWDRAEEASS